MGNVLCENWFQQYIILLMTLGMFLSICAKLIQYHQSFKRAEPSCNMVISHGLFPHFKQMILDEILKSPFISILYDESLNESIQKNEMDIHVRYWNEGENKVTVQYWTSLLLGHT